LNEDIKIVLFREMIGTKIKELPIHRPSKNRNLVTYLSEARKKKEKKTEWNLHKQYPEAKTNMKIKYKRRLSFL